MNQGQRAVCATLEAMGLAVFSASLTLSAASCSKNTEGQAPAGSASVTKALSTVSENATVAALSATAQLPPGGFDSCLAGSWKTTEVVLRREQIASTGGAGIAVEIKPTGVTEIDFGPMSPITANAPPTTFSYSYSGKATATLSTPSVGAYKAESVDYSKVLVNAKVSLPGAGAVELFKNTPLKDVEALGKAAGKVDEELPLPEAASPGPQAIDHAPILSGTAYICSPDKLELKGPPGSPTWYLGRAR